MTGSSEPHGRDTSQRGPSAPLVYPPLYVSSNGDRWRLVTDETSRCVLVRHEANVASGGHVTDMEVGQFMRMSAASPEREAVRMAMEAAGVEFVAGIFVLRAR